MLARQGDVHQMVAAEFRRRNSNEILGEPMFDETAKLLVGHIERCTFPQWDESDFTKNIAMPTENE